MNENSQCFDMACGNLLRGASDLYACKGVLSMVNAHARVSQKLWNWKYLPLPILNEPIPLTTAANPPTQTMWNVQEIRHRKWLRQSPVRDRSGWAFDWHSCHPLRDNRGRTVSYPTAPSQIPARGITAPGSSKLLTLHPAAFMMVLREHAGCAVWLFQSTLSVP